MVVDTQEASRALDEIESVRGRVSELRYYRHTAPYFIMWGVIWLIGNGSVELAPHGMINGIWAVLITIGVAGSVIMGMARAGAVTKRGEGPARKGWNIWLRGMAVAVMTFGFIFATMLIFGPTDAMRMDAFISITVGFIYMGTGLALNAWRVFALGLVVSVLTLVGFLWVADHFFAWMAIVGGGALIVGGILVRRI